jgi:hypothetical protein
MLCLTLRYSIINHQVLAKLHAVAAETALNPCKHDILGHNVVISRGLVRCGTEVTYHDRGENRNTREVENMRTNLKMILSSLGVAALLVSPVLAKTERHHHVAPSDARGYIAPYGTTEGGPYTPDMPASRHGLNQDFQDGSRG